MDSLALKFLKVFDGYDGAYGQHGSFIAKANGKMEGRAQTILGKLNIELVIQHLSGTGDGVGIIPLKRDNTCKFGCIDLDISGVNPLHHTIDEMEEKVTKLGLPLVLCTTKSKGIHLYCFTVEPIPAELMIRRLREWASLIGYGTAEIFPKQSYRVNEQDVGNWINVPYQNHKETTRSAFNKGKLIGIDDFFELVEVMRISTHEMENFQIQKLDESLNDAPPCLQILADVGIEEGSRNNGAYNFAVYYKMKNSDNWQDKLMELNGKSIKPPLTIKELETIIRSVSKKDFFYKCKEYPICQYCNKQECFKRPFGIGSSNENEVTFENLTKYTTGDEIIWFAECQAKRVQLSTDELLNQSKLQKKLLDVLNIISTPIKQNKWNAKINDLLISCTIVVEPEQASRKGQFFEILDAFLTEGVSGEIKDDLLKYNTYTDAETETIFFRSFNLFNFLKNKRFKHSEQEVWIWMKEKGAKSQKMKIAKKSLNVWSLPAPEAFQFENNDEERI